ncbi:UNVERIFIED_CONTAM: hypothetical protein GTU68_065782 [Idotea baltica]|nr:hypothetical protein [Idotea baltica]
MHFTIKSVLPEWFKGRDPKDPVLRKVLERGILLPLRDPDNKGRIVIFFRQGIYKPDEFPVEELTKAVYMIADVFYEEDEVHTITGIVTVMDLEGITAGHMVQYPLPVIKKSMVLWQVRIQ